MGDSALLNKSPNRKSAPRWRGPAEVLQADDAGEEAKVHGQTFEAAQSCVRENAGAQDVVEMNWNPALGGLGHSRGYAFGGFG